jgi:hypothetical protein
MEKIYFKLPGLAWEYQFGIAASAAGLKLAVMDLRSLCKI